MVQSNFTKLSRSTSPFSTSSSLSRLRWNQWFSQAFPLKKTQDILSSARRWIYLKQSGADLVEPAGPHLIIIVIASFRRTWKWEGRPNNNSACTISNTLIQSRFFVKYERFCMKSLNVRSMKRTRHWASIWGLTPIFQSSISDFLLRNKPLRISGKNVNLTSKQARLIADTIKRTLVIV